MLKSEQETVISFNATGEPADVYSSMKRIVTKLERNPAFKVIERGNYERTPFIRGTIAAKYITIRNGKAEVEDTLECPRCGKKFGSKQGHANHVARNNCVKKEG